jgi:flagellar motor switch protein FliG
MALSGSRSPLHDMTGAQKAAVLMITMGKDQGATIMSQLSQADVESISREIANLKSVKSDVVDAVLAEYQTVAKAVQSFASGGVEFATEILEAAVGTDRARLILARIKDALVPSALGRLKKAPPDMLLSVLRGEHPQTLALILAHLDAEQAANVVSLMEPSLAGEVLYRMASMDKVSPDMLALVEDGLRSKTDLTLTQELSASGGPQSVANMLNFTPPSTEQALLLGISERDQTLAGQIKDLMFVFEDLTLLDGRSMQRLLRDVDGKELAVALKVASDGIKQHIFKNMSERAASALKEELEFLGAVKVKDVEAAHMSIVQRVRSLQEANEVTISGRGGGDVVL